MANRINVNFSTIFKRSSCLNALAESTTIDAGRRFEIVKNQIESIKEDGHNVGPSFKSSLRSFIESICNKENANKYYREPLFLIESLNDIDRGSSDYVLTEYTNRVLPYVKDLTTFEETLARYELTIGQRMMISECYNKFIIADRILNNHEKISKRFNITLEIKKVKGRNLRSVVEACCYMIDTYTIAPYAKFNLCLEEMGYVMDKEGIDYDKRDLVRFVTEYFLLRSPDLSAKDIKGYQTVLNENCYIEDQDNEYVSFVIDPTELNNSNRVSISKEINKFLMSPNKSLQNVEDMISNILTNTTVLDITLNIGKIFWLLWNLYENEFFEEEFFASDIFPNWSNMIVHSLESKDFSKQNLLDVAKAIENVKDSIICGSEDTSDYFRKACEYKKLLDTLIDRIEDLGFLNYSANNVNAIRFVNQECANPIAIMEFKIFKFHNLTRAAVNLDKFLKYKAKNVYDKSRNKGKKVVKKIKDVLFTESFDNIYEFIGEDAKADICVAQYYIDEDSIVEIQEYFEVACKEFNDKLLCENLDSIRCYYIINPGVLEVHLKEASSILMEEDDWKKVRSSYSSDLDLYIDEFAMVHVCLEELDKVMNNDELKNKLLNFAENENFDLDHYKVAMEALSLLDTDIETVNIFTEQFTNYRYNTAVLESTMTESAYNREVSVVENIAKKWNKEDNVPLFIQVEACEILLEVLNTNSKIAKNKPKPVPQQKPDTNKDSDNTNKDEEKKDKNPFKGINLNSMQLYLQGLKTKMKDMSTKEKEISRNLDNGFRLFVKSIKNALISDRREAIIKGSVIPSFSRCIKIAIGLAGVGVVTGNPIVPLLIAMGGFATSKKLTQKERVLLLDEIETELEVVEKEISMAESKNQMKKYRALLKYKKDLQRQYQRIRYNIRVGKDILPGSAEGVPHGND